MSNFRSSFANGYACLSAWTDLLDRINVFPVADGDTGTNLRISLAPLRSPRGDYEAIRNQLARSATGNSGNIAAAFFREFCRADSYSELADNAATGSRMAWQAVASPCAGTMLSVFDSLAAILARQRELTTLYSPLCFELQQAVRDTTRLLTDLSKADVVDSGALAMYVFFDGFFRDLTGQSENGVSIFDLFAGKLAISTTFQPEATNSYCVDAVIQMSERQATSVDRDEQQATVRDNLAELGESVVVVQNESFLKIHIHTPDPGLLRGQLGAFGDIVQWSDEEIDQTGVKLPAVPLNNPVLHIVTDAAGSITREMARSHGITLLDSYIVVGDDSRPESLYSPEQIYPLMRKGAKVTTAQASSFERHQHYQSLCRQFGPCLYLSVGAAFTGNYTTAIAWKKENDRDGLFTVLDTGAASGRLALVALLTARQTSTVDRPADLIDFARKMMAECTEYVFINELKYLVAGGRVSRASGLFGDLLNMKPIISPTIEGVKKVGVVRSTKAQLTFAMTKLREKYDASAAPTIMLQYSDNREWVVDTVRPQVRALLPRAEILLTPLSLTSGVHMGPGTWSLALASQPGR